MAGLGGQTRPQRGHAHKSCSRIGSAGWRMQPGLMADPVSVAQGVGLLGVRHWSSTGFALPPPPGQWAAQVSTALRLGAANADAATESSLTHQQAKALVLRWHRAKAAALGELLQLVVWLPVVSQRCL